MSKTSEDKRRGKRRKILETFSLFTVIPKRGLHRLPLHDISESGIGITVDAEGEDIKNVPLETGSLIDLRIYINPTLYFSTIVKVARIELRSNVRFVGAEFINTNTAGYSGIKSFLTMLDHIVQSSELDHK